MAEIKTKLNNASVAKFLKGIKDEQARTDCFQIVELMKKAAKAEPKMWGTSIVGFGSYPIQYANGRESAWLVIGFSPRKQNLTLYGIDLDEQPELLEKLGKHSRGGGCLYIKKLTDVDTKVLQKLITTSAKKKLKNASK